MEKPVMELDTYPYYGQSNIKSRGLKRLAFTIIPRHTLVPFWLELRMAVVRYRSRNTPRRYARAKDLLVNLGAGDKGKPGWVNVDAFRAQGVNCVWDCRKKLPFQDNSVKGIFTEHFFEHIDYTEEVPDFLSECHRVLEVGGVIRIIVPDAEKYLHAYCRGGWEDLRVIRSLDKELVDPWTKSKFHTRMELINHVFRQAYEHKYAYDYETIEFLLHRYGFSDVYRQDFGKSLLDELCIDLPARAPESLYVEAMKT